MHGEYLLVIRVLHTESSLGWGGQELRILTESEYLNSLGGFESSVICDHSALMIDRNRCSSVRVNTCSLGKKRIGCLLSLKAHIEQVRPHVIISHSSTDSWLAAVARKIWFPEVKLIRVRHVSAPVSSGLFTNWLYREADHIVTTSSAIREHLIEALGLDPATVTSIPTGIDTRVAWRTVSEEERSAARANFGFRAESPFVFGMISTLRSWKGHDDTLRALSRIPSGVLVIVGDGPQENNIRKRIEALGMKNRVILVGHTPDVRHVAAAFDAYLHPSYSNEGVSQSLLQAMSMGIPVIVSDIGGLNEVVENEVEGFLVPPRQIQTLSRTMLKLMTRFVNVEQLARRAREKVVTEHSITVRGEQMEVLLKRISRDQIEAS